MRKKARTYWVVGMSIAALFAGCKSGGGPEPEPPGDVHASITAFSNIETHQQSPYDASCRAEDGLTDVTFIYDGEMSQPAVSGTTWDTSFVDTPTRVGEKNIEIICEDVNEQVDSVSKTVSVSQHETAFDFEHDNFVQYQDGSMSFSVTDPDTLTKITFIETGPDGVNEFSVTPNTVGFDTTLARMYDNFGSANIRVEAETRNDTREEISFEEGFSVQETPYVLDKTLQVRNLFTKEGVDGYVTFPGFKTLRVENGVASIGLEDKINADSLANEQYRIHFEPDNSYINHSSIIRSENGELVPVDVLPKEYRSADGTQEWDYELHKKHLWLQGTTVTPLPHHTSERWADGAEVTVYLYDESVSTREGMIKTTNTDSLASKDFLEESEKVYQQLFDKVPSISATIKWESKDGAPQDIGNPEKDPDNYAIYVMGQPNAPYPLTASAGREVGWMYKNTMAQQTDPPWGVGNNGLYWGVRVDALEGLGVNTNTEANLTVAPDRSWTPFVQPFLDAIYARPAGSGYVELDYPRCVQACGSTGPWDVDKIPNKNGTYTTTVHDWVAPETKPSFED